jgi:hypothetical protein
MRRKEVPAATLAPAALATLYGWVLLGSTFSHPGSVGLDLNAPGTDWMVFYGAARSFIGGNLGLIYDGDRFTAYLNSTFSGWLSKPMVYRPWVYPPSYLLAVLPFGALPFAASYLLFQLVSAALLAAALSLGSHRSRRRALVACSALVCPAASINVAVGQNAFFSSALLVAGTRLLRTRPVVGGALLGVLSVKPQFWMLVPVALTADRNWTALGSSVVAAGALAGLSAGVFGIDAWRQWADLAVATYSVPNAKWIEYGRMWGDSVYACLVSGGASEGLANAAQVAAVVIAATAVYRAFRLPLPVGHQIAVLLAGTILAAPHSSLHDAVMLAVAATLWIGETAEGGASRWKWWLALSLWLAPLFNPPLIAPIGRLTPALVVAFIGMIITGGAPRPVSRDPVGVDNVALGQTTGTAAGR